MKGYLFLLLCLHLTALIFGQITFTREWVNGKRSSPRIDSVSSVEDISSGDEFGGLNSRVNLRPLIDYLIEVERSQSPSLRQIRYDNRIKTPLRKLGQLSSKSKGNI